MYCLLKSQIILVNPFLKRKIWRCFFQSLSLLPNQYTYYKNNVYCLGIERQIECVCVCIACKNLSLALPKDCRAILTDYLHRRKQLFLLQVYQYIVLCTGPSSFRGKGAVKPTFGGKSKKFRSQKYRPKFQMLFEQNIASNVTRNEESKHIKF